MTRVVSAGVCCDGGYRFSVIVRVSSQLVHVGVLSKFMHCHDREHPYKVGMSQFVLQTVKRNVSSSLNKNVGVKLTSAAQVQKPVQYDTTEDVTMWFMTAPRFYCQPRMRFIHLFMWWTIDVARTGCHTRSDDDHLQFRNRFIAYIS